MTGRVEGKVAFITGAARGQGRSHAVRLAQEGADIIAVDICAPLSENAYEPSTAEDLAETVRLVEDAGRRIIATKADVRDADQLARAVDDGVERLGRLDIVSANAGIGGATHKAHEIPEAEWNNMLDINLSGVWRTVKAAVPHIIAGGRGGAIVLTSSQAGHRGFENIAHYVAAKHGVIGVMRTFALELAPYSIRVNSVLPTTVDTAIVRTETMYRLFRPDLENPTKEDFAAAAMTMNALPVPWVEALDISNALLFLASDEARYITGVALSVDAGAALK